MLVHESFSYILRGNWYSYREDFERAGKDYEAALKLARRSGSSTMIGYALGNLGNIALREKNYNRALILYLDILRIYRNSGDRFNLAATYINLARAYRFVQDVEAERVALQQARSLLEQVRGEPRSLDSRINALRGLQGIYGTLGEYLWEKGDEKCAFEVGEASRARSLVDGWSLKGQDAAEPIEISCFDRTPRRWLPEVQRLLDTKTAVLSFKLNETSAYAWWIDGQVFAAGEIALSANRVNQLTTEFHNDLKQAGSTGTSGAAAALELSRHLLEPFADRLEGIDRLLVVADGSLQFIPFANLPDPRDGRPLLERLEISSIPSVTAFLRLHAVSTPVAYSKDIAIFGGATFDPEGHWRELPQTRVEAEKILALFPADRSRSFLGPQASVDSFLREDLSGFRYLQLATHGFFDQRSPEASGLVLSELDAFGRPVAESVLYPQQIVGRKLNAELVVLSACETGLARVSGEGMIGLPRAFLVAGARRVLVSLWKVKDEPTQELMVRFYRNLRRGQPAVSALRQAQLELSRTAGFEDPSNWAGFVLYGLP